MTHPDDELACAAWVKRLTSNRVSVWLSWTHSNDEREFEARRAADRLGVPQENLFFHNSPDGNVVDDIARLVPIFRAMCQIVNPDRVICGAFEQGHLDHDSTSYVINQVYNGAILETPLYHTYASAIQEVNRFSDPTDEQVISLSEEEAELKKILSRSYPSQWIGDLMIWYATIEVLRKGTFDLHRSERLRLQKPINFFEPAHPSELAAKVRKSAKWQRWEAAIKRLNS